MSEEEISQRTYRPPYTLIAWLAPILTPLGFALLMWSGIVSYGTKIAAPVIKGAYTGGPELMFLWGWIGLTVACAGWIAWNASRKRRGAARVLIFLIVWPAATVALGAAGASLGLPACMAAEK